MTAEETQTEFDRLVNRGIILGIVWMVGIGSVIALISGYQASKLFELSGGHLEGKGRIYKCYFIGITGLLVVAAAAMILILFRKK